MRAARAGLAALAVACAVGLPAEPAGATTEEFSTFDVAGQEADDESLLDHYLTRPPRAWRNEWERAPLAVRTAQGCLTSGQWFIDTDLKLRSALGRRAELGVDLRQSETDAATYDYLDFAFRFPTRYGTPGLVFRPLFDKSRQDVAVTWEVGGDTTEVHVRLAFTFEDLFNNLWAFRQSQVGQESTPYSRHPYEPALSVAVRRERWRAELGGRYLTPSVQRQMGPGGRVASVASLWGTHAHAALEVEALGFGWEARAVNHQAKSTEHAMDDFVGYHRNYRRRWSAETALDRTLGERLELEARWIYQERDQSLGAPRLAAFHGIDRMLALEARWAIRPTIVARLGALHDRISISRAGDLPFSYGDRTESRLFIGLAARFGRVVLSGVEGIELDREPYEVYGVHDKGFLHLQATF